MSDFATADGDLSSREQIVLTKATLRGAEQLGLNSTLLARILGLSPASVTRMRRGAFLLTRESKSFELAQCLVRLYRSLDSIVGGDPDSAQSWLVSPNLALGQAPLQMIQTVRGLVEVMNYLDSRRALL